MRQAPGPRASTISSFLSFERNVVVISATSLLINFGVQSFQPFIPLYLLTVGAKITDVGIVFLAIQVAATLATIPGGMIADRFGRKTVLVVGNAIGFGLYFALLPVADWRIALVVLFVATLFATSASPASSSTVAESVNKEERSKAFGTQFLFLYLGLASGAIVGGLFSNTVDIVLVGVAGLAAAFVRLIFLKETLPKNLRKTVSQPGMKKPFVVRMTRNVWAVLAVMTIFYFSSGLGQPLYAIFSTDILGLSRIQLGAMVGVGYLASMSGAFLVGRVSRKLDVIDMMGIGVLLSGLALIPWLYAPNALLAIAIFALSGFFVQFFFIGNQTLMANITTDQDRGSVIGLLTTMSGVAGVLGPYLGSQLWVLIDPRAPFLTSSLLAVAAAVSLGLVQESPPERPAKCPHCGSTVNVRSRFCDMCGRLLAFKTCQFCGRELESTAKYCDLCGSEQRDTAGQ